MTTREDFLHWLTNRGRTLPAKASADQPLLSRSDDVGTLQVQSQHARTHALARGGQYFVYRNPTPGTGAAGIAATGAFSALETFMHLRNTYSAADAKWINLDYIRLQTTVAGTNGTNLRYAMALEPAPTATRYTSGNDATNGLITGAAANNVNGQSTVAPSMTLRCGPLITTAASSLVRYLSDGLLRTVISVVGDQFLFVFGAGQPRLGSHIVAGTAIANIMVNCPPVILGPGDEFLLHEHAASQTVGQSYEYEVGFWVE